MDKYSPKKDELPNLNDPEAQKAFTKDTKDSKELIQKELNVNKAEQNLLQKRIDMAKGLINDLPTSDPQYSMLLIQMQMDQVELDELKIREINLNSKLLEIKEN